MDEVFDNDFSDLDFSEFADDVDVNINNTKQHASQPYKEKQTQTQTKQQYTNTSQKQNDKSNKSEKQLVTFFRPTAMMQIVPSPEDKQIMFRFMQGEGKSPKDGNKYIQDTKTLISLSEEELYILIFRLNEAYSTMKQGKMFEAIKVVHSFNNDIKTLVIQQANNNPSTVYVGLTKGQIKYSISMDIYTFKYFITQLKLSLYHMVTGTLQGFNVNWI